MKRIFIVALEPVDTRYTQQWHDHIPKDLAKYAMDHKIAVEIQTIDGESTDNSVSPGAFLDFAGTNRWKSEQLIKISNMFKAGKVTPGDIFLYTDAWNPTVIQLKYMSELLNVPVKIIGISHAGSYDPQDFLGRLVGNKPWVRHAEKSMFNCFDLNIFATNFHMKIFFDELLMNGMKEENPWHVEDLEEFLNGEQRAIRSGFPMSYFPSLLEPYRKPLAQKKNLIVFPHRKAPEKQVEIFLDLAKTLPQFEWVVCQDKKLTKEEYHNILGDAKIVFSANLQETLGIGCIEGLFSDAIPMVPDRLSYSEMYDEYFKYPSKWTESWQSYVKHKDELVNEVVNAMETFGDDNYKRYMKHQKAIINERFISPKKMYDSIFQFLK